MAKVEYGAVTFASSGSKVILLNDSTMNVSKVVFFVSSSATEASAGYSDITTTFTGGSAYGDENDTCSITHYRNVSGTKTKVLEATVPGTGFSTAGEIGLNVTTLTQTTQVKFVAYGS